MQLLTRLGIFVTLLVVGGCATTTAGRSPSSAPPSTPTQIPTSRPNEIPVGQELDVRLQSTLNSGTATVEERFEATTVVDLIQDGNVVVPAGSVVRGIIRSVDRATRTDRTGGLTLAFDQMTVRGREYRIRANATQAFESEGLAGEGARIGTGAGVGGIIGGIFGGFKGALAGILIGGGGTIAATEGKDVNLPAGTILRIRMDSPVTIRDGV